MCNLYSNTTAPEAMRQLFSVRGRNDHTGNAQPLPSIFPGNAAPLVRLTGAGERELVVSRFGCLLPQRSKRTGKPILPKPVTNARQDKLLSSPFWKQSFLERRCLVPASAFCEMKGRRPAVHVWFGVTGSEGSSPFAFAGIWRQFTGRYRDEHQTFTTHAIVTTTPNALVATVHPTRMPVILDPDDHETWLAGPVDVANRLLGPFPSGRMGILASGAGMTSFDAGGSDVRDGGE